MRRNADHVKGSRGKETEERSVRVFESEPWTLVGDDEKGVVGVGQTDRGRTKN